MVDAVTPWAVAPPLLPFQAPMHGGAYTDALNWVTPAAHLVPLTAVPEPIFPPVAPFAVLATPPFAELAAPRAARPLTIFGDLLGRATAITTIATAMAATP